jgi:AraC family transcriptional regulator
MPGNQYSRALGIPFSDSDSHENALGFVSGQSLRLVRTSARDEKRISEALHYIECNGRDPLALDALAAHVGMSKYHFLRTFGRIVGMSPYQYLLNMRLRRAAVRLATSAAPVAPIALEEGFGDLSTFNRRFRSIFGESPQKFRRKSG